MPPLECRDSEDEDDDIFAIDFNNNGIPSQESTHSWAVREAEEVLAQSQEARQNALNNPQPPGTTSSELLREVANAQQNLFGTAPEQENAFAMPSSTSPALQRKRRQTANHDSGNAATSPARSVKRARTTNLKTYGSKGSRTILPDDDDHAVNRTSETAAATSETARFSDHSDSFNAETEVPFGTIQQDFMDHEPAVMFRDTGSTLAYNESSEQRLVEQARINSSRQAMCVPAADVTQSEKHDSSPFPFSAQDTQSPKSNQSNSLPGGPPAEQVAGTGITGDEITVNMFPATRENEPAEQIDTLVEPEQRKLKTRPASVPKSSPVVEIRRRKSISTAPPDDSGEIQNDGVQKKTRGRRRKTHNSSDGPVELLNSDEREIGAPREQYKPRPSRRRATEVVTENIDFSVVPEKAARKRRKTANAATASLSESTQVIAPAESPKNKSISETTSFAASAEDEPFKDPLPGIDEITVEQPAGSSRKPEPQRSPAKPEPSPVPGDTPTSLKSSQDAIAMPPPSLPASATKKRSRRSHTTIFEDHVSSPNLSQQQASRRFALKDLSNEASQRKPKKSRTILDSDEDEEDELAKEDEPPQQPTVPKKRGRPAKAAAEKKPISTEKVLEDSEAEDDDFDEQVEEPQKKQGRGRGKKAQEKAPAPATKEPVSIDSSDMSAVQKESSPARAALQRKDPNQQIDVDPSIDLNKNAPAASKNTPSPSPEKPSAKASPAAHSPIKSQGIVPYRVGLSKRSRIPSLLKTFRPPPKQSTR